MKTLNYANFPGPGDLADDYEDDGFGRDEAITNVVASMHEEGDLDVMITIVAEAQALLMWIGREHVIPENCRVAWRELEDLSANLNKRINEELEALNAYNDPREFDGE